MNMGDTQAFQGAKAALFIGEDLAVILRDDKLGLPWANHWDFPGGGREGAETPFDCLRRECDEELGLILEPSTVVWERAFETADGVNWFFVVQLGADAVNDVVFGDEGQTWCLMSVADYLSHPRAIPRFQERLQVALQRDGSS